MCMWVVAASKRFDLYPVFGVTPFLTHCQRVRISAPQGEENDASDGPKRSRASVNSSLGCAFELVHCRGFLTESLCTNQSFTLTFPDHVPRSASMWRPSETKRVRPSDPPARAATALGRSVSFSAGVSPRCVNVS
jgi:hypothetical protein